MSSFLPSWGAGVPECPERSLRDAGFAGSDSTQQSLQHKKGTGLSGALLTRNSLCTLPQEPVGLRKAGLRASVPETQGVSRDV